MVMLTALLRRYVEGDQEGFRVRAVYVTIEMMLFVYTLMLFCCQGSLLLACLGHCHLLHVSMPAVPTTCLG